MENLCTIQDQTLEYDWKQRTEVKCIERDSNVAHFVFYISRQGVTKEFNISCLKTNKKVFQSLENRAMCNIVERRILYFSPENKH